MPASRIVIVIGGDGDAIRDFFGPSYNGLPIEYVEQTHPQGLAHAVSLAAPFVRDALLVINGDEIFLENRHAEAWRFFEATNAEAIVGYLITQDRERIRIGYGMQLAEDGRVLKLIEKPKETWNSILGVGTWLMKCGFFDSFHRTPLNVIRRERDFVDVIQLMVDEGKVVYGYDLQGEFHNLNKPDDLLRAEAALGRRAKAVGIAR